MTFRPMLAAIAALAVLAPASAAASDAGGAAGLKAKFEALGKQPTPFGIPLFIESSQAADRLAGDIHSRLDRPYEAVRSELARPRTWCEILILHPNVKACAVDAGDASLTVRLGSAETPATFRYRIAQSTPDYLDVRLEAPQGPFGTTNYAFRVEATPLDARSTLLHLAYAHNYGTRAKLALQAYFNTFGRGKVGFTVVGRTPEGKPVYVDDLRGGLERNAMRYYFAIQAHLDALSAAPGARLEDALARWHAQTERYPLQLKEEAAFLERKRSEIRRFTADSPRSG
jgi:hypothetical protein